MESANGSMPDLTFLVGKAVANTETILVDLREVRTKVDFLMQENVQRKSDHQALRDHIEQTGEPPTGFTLLTLSDLMERGGKAFEIGKATFEALMTFRTIVTWLIPGTAIYKMIFQPLETKHFLLSFLGWIGLS